jgi:hypothetical protein
MSNGYAQPAPKSGKSMWLKIALGCGCLALVIGAAIAGFMFWGAKKAYEFASDPAKMAEMVINADPDLEVVNNDKDAGTITVKNTKTGEETTINYADIKAGNLKIEGKDGATFEIGGNTDGQDGAVKITGPDGQTATFGSGADAEDVPDWVPLYEGAQRVEGTFKSEVGGKIYGLVNQETGDSLDVVKSHFENVLKAQGYEVNLQEASFGDQKTAAVLASKGGRSINVGLTTSAGRVNIAINYNE